MLNLRKLMLLTNKSKAPVRVYAENRKTYLILNAELGSAYPGEIHVKELDTNNGEICAYTNISDQTINVWKREFECN